MLLSGTEAGEWRMFGFENWVADIASALGGGSLSAGVLPRAALTLFLFGAFMVWPWVLIVTPFHSRADGRVVMVYSVAIFLAGSMFFATLVQPYLEFGTARQLYLLYAVQMAGLFVKGTFHAFGGGLADDHSQRSGLPV
ncbi:MAG: hypothetical protein AAF737_05870 [Pseudomonadota bacterium]